MFSLPFETYQRGLLSQLRLQETTVYSSVFSSDGEYLLCGNVFGDVAIWRLKDYLKETYWACPASETPPPLRTWRAHTCGPIYALCFTKNSFLVSAGDEYMRIWNWEKILDNIRNGQGSIEYEFQLQNPTQGPCKELTETNGLSVDTKTGLLYSAAGDNNAYCWDLEKKLCLSKFEGHLEYLHCIKVIQSSGLLATGSEDGTVRIWDLRSKKSVSILDCTKGTLVTESTTEKSNHTNWITCLDTDDGGNWLVCGGGHGALAMWYLAMPSVTCYMPTQGNPQSALFSDGRVISAGTDQHISHWQLNGKLKVRVPTTAKCIYSLSINHNSSNKVLVACGTSPYVDVFTDITHKGFSFCFVPSE